MKACNPVAFVLINYDHIAVSTVDGGHRMDGSRSEICLAVLRGETLARCSIAESLSPVW